MGAVEFIHELLVRYRDEGSAILCVSADLQEIMDLSDRILVLFAGEIVGETDAERTDERQIGRWMLGIERGRVRV